jgi:hypothetical protein
MPCEPTHDATISVTQTGTTPATTTKALQVATQRTLAVGQSLIVTAAGEQRCNELSNTGTSRYYVAVSNTSTAYSTGIAGTAFQVRGAAGSGGSGLSPAGRMAAVPQPNNDVARRRPMTQPPSPEDIADQAHLRLLEQNIKYLSENRARMVRRGGATRSAVASNPAVGTSVSINVPNINNTANICLQPFPITGKIVYVGSKSVIVEDQANPVLTTSATGGADVAAAYNAIGAEFDATMFGILSTNFGDPLARDAVTDNNGRIVMVFSNVVNTKMPNLAGFVVTCDFATSTSTTNSQTNTGEYFYARVPTVSSPNNISTANSPAYWSWTTRGTIIHEVKHIVSFAERIARGAPTEESWLEESTARLSEELYDRAAYSFTQKANTAYGTSANPVGPYCGVRGCGGKARGIIRVFEELAPKWYTTPENYSPLGRIDANDFSFYATGWSLIRWAVDQSSTPEATFLKALTQESALTGVANLQARTGRTFAEMLPEWTMANVLDDYPGWTPAATTPASGRMAQLSWNFRDVFSKYKADFATSSSPPTWSAWPLNPYARSFGTFTVDAAVKPGTSAIIELSGTAAARQLLELKAQTGTAAAPAELRITIVRVQ